MDLIRAYASGLLPDFKIAERIYECPDSSAVYNEAVAAMPHMSRWIFNELRGRAVRLDGYNKLGVSARHLCQQLVRTKDDPDFAHDMLRRQYKMLGYKAAAEVIIPWT